MAKSAVQNILALLRVEQWIKNLLVFLPAFFAQRIGEVNLMLPLLTGFIAFCLTSGAIYIFNDYKDLEWDRQHPEKRGRPLASGSSSKGFAFVVGLIAILSSGLFVLLSKNFAFALILGTYLFINILYSIYLKKIAILDLAIIGSGFILRIFAGAVLAGVFVSHWLAIMIFLGALLIGLGKRRNEVLLLESGHLGKDYKLPGYNRKFIDLAMVFATSITTVAYIMYTVSPEVTDRIGNDLVYITGIFVILGMLKFLQLVFVYGEGGNPTQLFLQNRSLQLIVLLWIITFVYLLYLN